MTNEEKQDLRDKVDVIVTRVAEIISGVYSEYEKQQIKYWNQRRIQSIEDMKRREENNKALEKVYQEINED